MATKFRSEWLDKQNEKRTRGKGKKATKKISDYWTKRGPISMSGRFDAISVNA